MIMAVKNVCEKNSQKKIFKVLNNKRGQSLFEFVLFLPFIAVMIMYLVQINGAMNASINYQQFARAKLFQLMFNKREYPTSRFVYPNAGNRFYLGVNGEVIPAGANFKDPEALLVKVGNEKSTEEIGIFPDISERQNIRIKNVVGICTPNNIRGETVMSADTIDERYGDFIGKSFCSK